MLSKLHHLLVLLLLLLSVAFVTLFERKVLGYTQTRVGPNKVTWGGLLQPLLDALKLLSKPSVQLTHYTKLLYWSGPILSLILSICLWYGVSYSSFQSSEWLALWWLAILGLGTYSILLSGWASFSKYSLLGSWRSLSQAFSYEVLLVLMIWLFFWLNQSFQLNSENSHFFYLGFPLWILVLLSETQRAPLDLTEGESELVSGFNTEFSGLLFTFLFLAEYSSILALSVLSSWIWVGGSSVSVLALFTLWMWLRTVYPRIKYDQWMSVAWKFLLPLLIWSWLTSLGWSWN